MLSRILCLSSLTLENGTDLGERTDGPAPGVLPNRQLHEEQRQPAEQDHDEVGDEEGPASALVAKVREPPDVAESHRRADAGQQELDPTVPALAGVGPARAAAAARN